MIESVELELTRALDQAGIALPPGLSLGLKGRLLDRIRAKLLGRPRILNPPIETTAATEEP